MSYRSIHIPLSGGQNEGVDEKLLPDGEFHSVQNFYVQRDGRTARRKGVSARADGGMPTARVESMVGDGNVVIDDLSKDWFHPMVGKYVDTPSGGDSLLLLNGYLPLTNSVRHVPLQDLPGSNDGNYQLGKTFDGMLAIVRAFVPVERVAASDAVGVRFSLVDPESFQERMRFEATFETEGSEYSYAFGRRDFKISIKQVGVACDDTAKRAVVLLALVDERLSPPNRLWAIHLSWDDDGITEVYRQQLDRGIVSGDPTTGPYSFDVTNIPGKQRWVAAFRTQAAASSGIHMEGYKYDASDAGEATPGHFNSISGIATAICTIWSNGDRIVVSSFHADLAIRPDGGAFIQVWSMSTDSNAAPLLATYKLASVDGDSRPVMPWMIAGHGDGVFLLTSYGDEADSFAGTVTAVWPDLDDPDGIRTVRQYALESAATWPVAVVDAQGRESIRVASETAPYSVDVYGSGEFYKPGGQACEIVFDPSDGNTPMVSARLAAAEIVTLRPSLSWRGKPQFFNLPSNETIIYWPMVGRVNNVPGFNTLSYERFMPRLVKTGWGDRFRHSDTRVGETLVSGGTIYSVFNDDVYGPFNGSPVVVNNPEEAPEDEVICSIVLQTTDDLGRIWKSEPSAQRSVDVNAVGFAVPVGIPPRTRALIYASEPGESVLYLRNSRDVLPGGIYTGASAINISAAGPVVDQPYDQLGEGISQMPPPCSMVVFGRDRAWACGLESPELVQASKIVTHLEGVQWNNSDAYKVAFPEPVTALAPMDDAVLVFTELGVYVIHGSGPDASGVGGFPEPQSIPSSVGCVSHKSVVTTEAGVLFQSQRGLEIVKRGFASPQWIGQAVRDVLTSYPKCLGVVSAPGAAEVRWLFSNGLGDQVVIHLDIRTMSWSKFFYEKEPLILGLLPVQGTSGMERAFSFTVGTAGNVFTETKFEHSEDGQVSEITTGNLRMAGIQGWAFGRRAHILGTWGGRACDVTLEFAFDGARFLPQDTFTWAIDSSTWAPGAVELELTLPVHRFSSVQFRLKVSHKQPGDLDTFLLHGLTVYYEVAPSGPRLGQRSKG